MAELVDAPDSKSSDSNIVRVQVPLRPPNEVYKNKTIKVFFLWNGLSDRSRWLAPPRHFLAFIRKW